MNVFYNLISTVDFSDIIGRENPNAFYTASYFDTLNPAAGSDLQYIFETLNFLKTDEMRDAFDQMHPAIYKGFAIAQEANSIRMTSMEADRARAVYGSCCTRGCDRFENGFWVTPYGDFIDQRTFNKLQGFDAKSGGVLAGYDKRICSHAYLGLSGGYSHSSLDWNSHRGKGKISSGYGGIYAFWFNHRCYFNFSAYGAYNDYSGRRNIDFSTVHRTAKHCHDGAEGFGHIDGGIFFRNARKNIEIRQTLSLDYIFIHEEDFTEKGADSLNLHVNSQNYQLWRPEISVYFVKCFSRKSCCIIPEIGLGYIREIRDGGKHYITNLVGEPGDFRVKGICDNRDIFAPSVSINWVSNSAQSTCSLGYKGEYGKHKFENNVFLQLLVRF